MTVPGGKKTPGKSETKRTEETHSSNKIHDEGGKEVRHRRNSDVQCTEDQDQSPVKAQVVIQIDHVVCSVSISVLTKRRRALEILETTIPPVA
jgi:hypothetical protein